MSPTLSEEQYVSKLRLISTEIENAFIIFHTYEELNRLAHNDSAVLAVLNADALFWNTYRNTLVTSLFMTTSRLFDPVAEAITIQTVVTATLGNLHLFSKEALRVRKIGKGPELWWLDESMEKVWVPTEPSQLRHLQKALKPHVALFKSVYLPIRNSVYAHRLMSDDQAGDELYPKTNREELGVTLHFLQDLIDTIQDLYDNGTEPILGQRNLGENAKQARSGVEKILRKLAVAS